MVGLAWSCDSELLAVVNAPHRGGGGGGDGGGGGGGGDGASASGGDEGGSGDWVVQVGLVCLTRGG